jgi:hypothetical protein
MKSVLTGRDESDWLESLVGDEADHLRHQIAHDQELDDEMRHAIGGWLTNAAELWLAGRDQASLASLARAWNMRGLAQGLTAANLQDRERMRAEALASIARKGADAKHAENRSMRLQVTDYYMANRATFESKDAAAEKMAGKLVPVTFRTVRSWLSGLPPAGKA